LAAVLIGQLGTEGNKAATSLLAAFKDDDAAVRSAIGAALWQVAPEDEAVVTALRDAIRSDELSVVASIASVIFSEYSAVAGRPDAHGTVVYSIESNTPGLGSVEIANGVNLLIEAMRLPTFARGRLEAESLGRPGGATPGKTSEGAILAYTVVQRLSDAGPRAAKSAVPKLTELAKSDQPALATAAVEVLFRIGPAAAAALPTLRSLIEQRSKQDGASHDPLLPYLLNAVSQIEEPVHPSNALDPYGRSAR
jgi:hypothetical protein